MNSERPRDYLVELATKQNPGTWLIKPQRFLLGDSAYNLLGRLDGATHLNIIRNYLPGVLTHLTPETFANERELFYRSIGGAVFGAIHLSDALLSVTRGQWHGLLNSTILHMQDHGDEYKAKLSEFWADTS